MKGIGGQAILPFLETPETKVQIVMIIHVGNFCVQAWGLIGSYTLRISSGNKCHSDGRLPTGSTNSTMTVVKVASGKGHA